MTQSEQNNPVNTEEHGEKSNKSNTLKNGDLPIFEDWVPPTAAELDSMFEESQRQLGEIIEHYDNPENWDIPGI